MSATVSPDPRTIQTRAGDQHLFTSKGLHKSNFVENLPKPTAIKIQSPKTRPDMKRSCEEPELY